METTFLTDKSGPEGQIFIVMSAGQLRDMWATRLRNEIYDEIRATGIELVTVSERDRELIEEIVVTEAENKFSQNVNYRVRALEDDALTPVAIFGEEAYVISESVIPCTEYEWDLSRVNPIATVMLRYVACNGLLVEYSALAGDIVSPYLFSGRPTPVISDGILTEIVT
jgi:hypothetical protein